MTKAEKLARIEEIRRKQEARALAEVNAIQVNTPAARDARRRLNQAKDDLKEQEEIADGGILDSERRTRESIYDNTVGPALDFVDANALKLASGLGATYGAGEAVNALKHYSSKLDLPSEKVTAGAEKLDATPTAGLKTGQILLRTGAEPPIFDDQGRHVSGTLDPTKSLNANPETKDILKDFKAKLKAEGINYDNLKNHPGSMKSKLTAEFKTIAEKKYSPLIKKLTPSGKRGKKIALWGGGVPAAALLAGEGYNIATSMGASREAKEAQEEVKKLQQKIPALLRDYHIAQKSYVDGWMSENTPDTPDYGRYKMLSEKLGGLIK